MNSIYILDTGIPFNIDLTSMIDGIYYRYTG